MWEHSSQAAHKRPVRLAYQPPANSIFLSQQISHQQPASSTLLSEQTSTRHQPPANRTGCTTGGLQIKKILVAGLPLEWLFAVYLSVPAVLLQAPRTLQNILLSMMR
jgi:hypothetical protein